MNDAPVGLLLPAHMYFCLPTFHDTWFFKHFEETVRRPLLPPLAGLITGIAAANSFPIDIPPAVAVAAVVIAGVSVFTGRARFHGAAVFLMFLIAGILSGNLLLRPNLPSNDLSLLADSEIILEGLVDERPHVSPEGAKVILRGERIYRGRSYAEVSGRILLQVKNGVPEVATGDRVRVMTTPRVPAPFGLPGEFDYRKFLAWQNIYATGTVREAADIVLIQSCAEHPIRWRMDHLARHLSSVIAAAVPGEEGGVVAALVLGDCRNLSRETSDAYAVAGVNHILSISGFHMAVISAAVFQVLLFIGRRIPGLALSCNLRKILMLLALPVLGAYLFLIGPAPAAVRSVIMIAACIAALSVERETDGIDILMFAALVILVLQPGALFNISFQLSFLALWGLIVLTPLFLRLLPKGDGFVRIVVMQIAASLAAIAATFLPVLFYFHRASITGVVANLVVVPLLGYGGVICGFAGLLLALASPTAAVPFFKCAGFLVYLSDKAISSLAGLPTIPPFAVTRLHLLILLVILSILTFFTGRWRKLSFTVVGALMVAGMCFPARKADGNLRVTFFSLGQSESSLLLFPDGKTMLIDGGGSLFEGGMDVGERLLLPALRELGVGRIDYMVLTHPHPDHLKGLPAVASALPVGEFWETGLPGGGEDYRRLLQVLRQKGTTVRRFVGYSAATAGGLPVDVLAPEETSGVGEDAGNDDSLVLRIRHGDTSFLFTGDIGFERERILLRRPELLRATVLKVPHHGSRWSSSNDFLAASRARIGLISAGRGNAFHLPSGDALRRLRSHNVTIYRTDQDGTIDVVSDGASCRVSTFVETHY